MPHRRPLIILCGAVLWTALASPTLAHSGTPEQTQAPRILLDMPLRAVEYQLQRLTNDELVLVERKDTDVRYRPVYVALLTRRNLPAQFREEALAALTKMDKAGPTQVLLETLAKVPAADDLTAGTVVGVLLAQPADALRQQRAIFIQAIDAAASPAALRGAYGALMTADGKPDQAWDMAATRDGHLQALLRSVRHLGSAELRGALFTPIASLAGTATDAAVRADALAALGWTRRDAATFDLLAQAVIKDTDAAARAAAIQSLLLIPRASWSQGSIEPLARAIVALVKDTAPGRRTEPATIDAIQLGESLAAALPAETGRAVRRDLRGAGVQIVRITAVPEQMIFDLNWFAVEAGRQVQIVLDNTDAMQHNLLVGQPGSIREIGTAAATMPLPTDPGAKPYVPNSPLVLQATKLLSGGEIDRLTFRAPQKPGEYPYLCTFPGHWVRMYGVMLVVENLDQWEAAPTVPTDPMTSKPFTSQRN
jgi:azurin/DNA-binding transcriptional ArsR family regulator